MRPTSIRRVAAPSAIATEIDRRFNSASVIGVSIATASARLAGDVLRKRDADAYGNLPHRLSLAQADLPDWLLSLDTGAEAMMDEAVRQAYDRLPPG